MDIVIRKYEMTDYFKVSSILKEAFNIEKVNTTPSSNYTELVADLSGEAIGYLVLTEEMDIVKAEKYFLVNYVCVENKYQNSGVGSMLLDEAIRLCQEKKASYIELTSNRRRCSARHLYSKKGFEIRDTDVFRKGLL